MEKYRRTPRGYDGTKNQVKHVSEITPFIMDEITKKYNKQTFDLVEAWEEICGDPYAKYTKAITVKDDKLIIHVKNSLTLEQLFRNHDEYLKKIYNRFTHKPIKYILFKIA